MFTVWLIFRLVLRVGFICRNVLLAWLGLPFCNHFMVIHAPNYYICILLNSYKFTWILFSKSKISTEAMVFKTISNAQDQKWQTAFILSSQLIVWHNTQWNAVANGTNRARACVCVFRFVALRRV